MTKRRYAVLLAFALCAGTAFLSGCGATNPGNTSVGQNQIAKADVTVAAKFPTPDGAVKSLIPAAAQAIEVYAQAQPYTYDPLNPNPYGTLIATLTPTEQSKTVQIAAGMYLMYAIAYDSADTTANRTIVGRTMSGGEVLSGQANSIILTFMDGQWTVVDANSTPSPLVLSNGAALNDFIVSGNSGQQMFKAGKSAIDYTKPVGFGGGVARFRFSNNTSARTYGVMVSQFVGTTSTMIYNDGYNLTKKCSNQDSTCYEGAGDQILMVSGKGGGGSGSTGLTQGNILSGSSYELLPAKGQTTFTQNGTAIDLMNAIPDTIVTGGNLITGAVIEWKPSSDRTTTLGTAPVAKRASSAKVVKAQSTNTAYTGLAIKNYQAIVCSGASPQNRGTWTFANNTSAGKVVIGSKVCYANNPNVSSYDPVTYSPVTPNAGDYSYGLAPLSTADLGDYCHVWDTNPYIYGTTISPNPNYNTCKQQLPGSGDVYSPWNFRAVKSATKTAISYGSFKFSFWGEENQTGAAYIYPFRAKGSTTITPAK